MRLMSNGLKPVWWSSKGAWRTLWQRKLDEGMEASWKALASNGKWERW